MGKKRRANLVMLEVDKNDNIIGTKRVPTLLPNCVLCSDRVRRMFVVASQEMMDDGRTDSIKIVRKGANPLTKNVMAAGIDVPPDTRPKYSIDIKQNQTRKSIHADGVEAVTIEVKKLGAGDKTDKTFNGMETLDVGDRELEFEFKNGVATRQYKSNKAGFLNFHSRGKQKIVNPDLLIVVE